MTLTRWDPIRDLLSLQNEVGQIFERTYGIGHDRRKVAWTPAVDILDRDDAILVKADLPEVGADDVNVTVEDDYLSITGERKFKDEAKEDNIYRLERRYGSFTRTIQVPVSVKQDEIKASFENGVLEIVMPKAEEISKTREIKIEAGSAKKK